jgi:hypothetical protein
MRSRGAHEDLVLLNSVGQAMLLNAFADRVRPRSSFLDFADAYVQGLRDAGVLEHFQEPGVDPFAVLANVNEFGLERAIAMQQESFKWPSAAASPGSVDLGDVPWPKVGLLKHLGYTVGMAGKAEKSRQRILDRVYQDAVPQVISKAHMKEWGSPRTGPRLKKMADCIAAFVRNAKRREESVMTVAIAHWEADLRYLKREYYDGRYDFPWPDTSVRRRISDK